MLGPEVEGEVWGKFRYVEGEVLRIGRQHVIVRNVETGEEETLTPDQVVGHQRLIDPNHDEVAECAREGCRHPYYRHFDPFEGNTEVGCKYCSCESFVEPGPEVEVVGRYETLGGDDP